MCFSHRWSGSPQSAHSVPSHEPHLPGSTFPRFHDQTCNPQCSLASRRPQKQREGYGDRTARVLVVGPLCDLTAEPQGHLWKRGPVGIGVSVLKYLELGKKTARPIFQLLPQSWWVYETFWRVSDVTAYCTHSHSPSDQEVPQAT